MNSISIMVKEHENISEMILVIRKICINIFNNDKFDINDVKVIIDFIKNYSDIHHHGKEEQFLFDEMVNKLGRIGKNIIVHGMLVEHDYARLYVKRLSDAVQSLESGYNNAKVNIIANLIGYSDLIELHMKKEDQLIYKYAEKNLPYDSINKINAKTLEFEKISEKYGVQEKYLGYLNELKEKYLY